MMNGSAVQELISKWNNHSWRMKYLTLLREQHDLKITASTARGGCRSSRRARGKGKYFRSHENKWLKILYSILHKIMDLTFSFPIYYTSIHIKKLFFYYVLILAENF